ncbi:hypothetical protein EYF80_003137 [Liparis tanakae]|uniref:Uncharacterized protein n=1 Tax=Liparis tanakae TaxID=230148 RepID=A0A4Z2J908_9TELE|nr:hypothetical protein EYF80_003137 [Liparis tanakae]
MRGRGRNRQQEKLTLGKRNKPGVEAASSPDSVRGRGENKAINHNDMDRDFWNNNDSSNVQQRWSSYPPKEFLLNMSPYTPYGDPRLTPNEAVDKGGHGGAGPSPGTSDSGGGACSGSGAGPSRSDSIRSMVMGGSRAGRWQAVQSHMNAGGLRFGNEGKMVVLSLAIGLAEQDDFANLPDLQEAPASKENETTPEKSYAVSSLSPSAGLLLAVNDVTG